MTLKKKHHSLSENESYLDRFHKMFIPNEINIEAPIDLQFIIQEYEEFAGQTMEDLLSFLSTKPEIPKAFRNECLKDILSSLVFAKSDKIKSALDKLGLPGKTYLYYTEIKVLKEKLDNFTQEFELNNQVSLFMLHQLSTIASKKLYLHLEEQFGDLERSKGTSKITKTKYDIDKLVRKYREGRIIKDGIADERTFGFLNSDSGKYTFMLAQSAFGKNKAKDKGYNISILAFSMHYFLFELIKEKSSERKYCRKLYPVIAEVYGEKELPKSYDEYCEWDRVGAEMKRAIGDDFESFQATNVKNILGITNKRLKDRFDQMRSDLPIEQLYFESLDLYKHITK